MIATKTFTPESARRAASGLRPVVDRLRRRWALLDSLRPKPAASDAPVPRGYLPLLERLLDDLSAVHATGAKVADPAGGAVDFPARLEGRPVLTRGRCHPSGRRLDPKTARSSGAASGRPRGSPS